MKARSNPLTVCIAALVAAAGLFAAHTLDYLIAFREPIHRLYVLDRTGHGYLPSVAGLAVAAAVVAVLLTVVAGVRGRNDPPRLRNLFAWLAVCQTGGFILLEVSERFVAGLPAHHLLSPVLPLGIVLQVAVAAVVAATLRVIVRASRALVRSSRRRTPRTLGTSRTTQPSLIRPRRIDRVRPCAPRSPPLLASV